MRKTEEARKPSSRGTSALWSVSQQGLWTVRPSLTHPKHSTDRAAEGWTPEGNEHILFIQQKYLECVL